VENSEAPKPTASQTTKGKLKITKIKNQFEELSPKNQNLQDMLNGLLSESNEAEQPAEQVIEPPKQRQVVTNP